MEKQDKWLFLTNYSKWINSCTLDVSSIMVQAGFLLPTVRKWRKQWQSDYKLITAAWLGGRKTLCLWLLLRYLCKWHTESKSQCVCFKLHFLWQIITSLRCTMEQHRLNMTHRKVLLLHKPHPNRGVVGDRKPRSWAHQHRMYQQTLACTNRSSRREWGEVPHRDTPLQPPEGCLLCQCMYASPRGDKTFRGLWHQDSKA